MRQNCTKNQEFTQNSEEHFWNPQFSLYSFENCPKKPDIIDHLRQQQIWGFFLPAAKRQGQAEQAGKKKKGFSDLAPLFLVVLV